MIERIVRAAYDGLRQDAAFVPWCVAQLGDRPRFFLGVDPANPPAKEDLPYVVVFAGSVSEDMAQPFATAMLCVDFGLTDEGVVENEDGDVEFSGISKLSQFREQLQAALVRVLIGYDVRQVDVDISPFADFPVFGGCMDVTVTERRSIGSRRRP